MEKKIDKESLKKYFLTDNKSGYKTRVNYIKKNFPELYNNIIDYNQNRGSEKKFTQMLYDYLYDIKETPKCLNCGKEIKWRNVFSEGYKKFCNLKCATNSTNIKEKIKKTNLERYGVEYASQSDKIKERVKKTNLERYGVENIISSERVKEIRESKMIEKYGVKHAMQSDKVKQKRKVNNLKKYGVTIPSKLDSVKEKMIETNLKKYGVRHSSQSEEIKNKQLDKKLKFLIDKNNLTDIIINYSGDSYIIENECSVHPTYSINKNLYYHRLKYGITNRCALCNPPSKTTSIKENELKEYIKNIGIEYIENDNEILDGKEIDIYLPEHKIGIEFNGLYWHSNKFLDKNYHLHKTELANTKGVKLLHVFEDEWLFKKEIIKSIINNKLKIYEKKIFARKCEIKEVSPTNARIFLDKNHIQGSINSTIKIGLYYNNELVSLMTFGGKRKSLGATNEKGHYEMYRFCNKINTVVVGGASKLFKYFIKNYDPDLIISYADRRYFDGSLYDNLGFMFHSSTNPNYWYFKEHSYVREHRYKYRKNIISDEKNKCFTEKEIMHNNGYLWVYDCGNIKYVYKKKPVSD